MNKYKIDFGIAFVVCIGIMVFEKLWNVLDDFTAETLRIAA